MKKQIIAVILGATTMLWSNDSFAYKVVGPNGGMQQNGGSGNGSSAAQEKGANCAPASAQLTMSFNDVSSFIEQGGSMWQDR